MYFANPKTGKLVEAPEDGDFYLSQGYVAIDSDQINKILKKGCSIKDIFIDFSVKDLGPVISVDKKLRPLSGSFNIDQIDEPHLESIEALSQAGVKNSIQIMKTPTEEIAKICSVSLEEADYIKLIVSTLHELTRGFRCQDNEVRP